MSDNLKNRGPGDRKRVSLTEHWEVDYWTKALGVSEERLREAVGAAGHMAVSIRAWLAANPEKPSN